MLRTTHNWRSAVILVSPKNLPFALITEMLVVIFTVPYTILKFVEIVMLYVRQVGLKYFVRLLLSKKL